MANRFMMFRGQPIPLDPEGQDPSAPIDSLETASPTPFTEGWPEQFAWGASGIPMALDGANDIQGAFAEDGAGTDALLGGAKVGLAALPFAGPLARAAFATAPRAMTAGGFYGLMPVLSDEAEAGRRDRRAKKDKPAPQPAFEAPAGVHVTEPDNGDIFEMAAKRDPRVKNLLEEQRRLRAAADTERLGRGGTGPRWDIAQAKLNEVNDKLRESVSGYLPFDQAVPGAKYWTAAQMVAPAIAALATRGAARKLLNMPRQDLNRSVAQAERMVDAGAPAADRKVAEVMSRLKGFQGKNAKGGGNLASDVVLPTIAGTMTGGEMSLYPHQYNRGNTLPGTREHDTAEKKLAPDNFLATAFPGMLGGGLAGFTAGHFPSFRKPVFPNVAGAEALVQTAGPAARAAREAVTTPLTAKAVSRETMPPLSRQPMPALAPAMPPLSRRELPPPAKAAPPAPKEPAKAPHKEARRTTAASVEEARDRGKSKTRFFDEAMKRAKSNLRVEDALKEIDRIVPNKGFSRRSAGQRKRMIKQLAAKNPNASGPDLARMIQGYIADRKRKGLTYSIAIGAGLGAKNLSEEK